MKRGAASLTLAVLVLAGCEPEARPLEWQIRFASPELAARAVVIEARVVRGRCEDAAAEPVYMALFTLAGRAPEPPRLGPGEYSIEAYARDASCLVFAGDCSNEQLPSADALVELVLQERPALPACAAGEACDAGRCESERVPDAGPADAGRRDAATPDGGMRDAGRVCVPDAVDGTGRSCMTASDCASGMLCYGIAIGFFPGVCTHGCGDETECVRGWSCGTAPSRDCAGGCPHTPICQCTSLFGPTDETQCDGSDGDCDGRIDEARDGMDLCGNGTCRCSGCDCDPGFTACGPSCVDTDTDVRHCGGCGAACNPGFECVGGGCVCRRTMCGTACVNLQTNESNCGLCDSVCASGFACTTGSCTCPRTLCGGTCIDTTEDESNCGGCGVTCASGVTPGCCAGTCIDHYSHPAHCGSCGNACPSTWVCCEGTCRPSDTCA
jgi:hypothetical protein